MSERISLGRPLPYEDSRDYDIDGSYIVCSKKNIPEGVTSQYFAISRRGRIREITVDFETQDENGRRLDIEYGLNRNGLSLTANDNISDYSTIFYNRDGIPDRIIITPFQPSGNHFWEDVFAGDDGEIVEREAHMREEAYLKLVQIYGDLSHAPKEELEVAKAVAPTFNQYFGQYLYEVRHSNFQNTEFVYRNGKWIVMDIAETSNGIQSDLEEALHVPEETESNSAIKSNKKTEIMTAEWNTPFIYNETVFVIGRKDGKLILEQSTVSGSKKKVIEAPLQVHSRMLEKAMKNPVSWDKVFQLYPSRFE